MTASHQCGVDTSRKERTKLFMTEYFKILKLQFVDINGRRVYASACPLMDSIFIPNKYCLKNFKIHISDANLYIKIITT